jgi:RHH-type proline utilization regulon transcriptional repressor/proline dehydrogenase/delta 1-pyrroline-5-carboxylate dehydrogenase
MRANSFQNAIDLANQSGFRATAGLECLDKLKQQHWKKQIRAGNVFINGPTSNAFVLRQPFGGWGKSVIGPGVKSGGPNYVTQFMTFLETGSPAEIATKYDRRLLRLAKNWIRKTDRSEFKEFQTDIQRSVRAMNSYLHHARHEFRVEKDFFHLRGQDNTIRYAPVGKVTIRVHPDDSLFEILARVAAAQTAKCKVLVSVPESLESKIISFLKKRERREFLRKIKISAQSDEQLIDSMDSIDRLRYASPLRVPSKVAVAAAQKGFFIAADPVLMEGRIELLHYYRSQSICNNYHRYGNLGTRAFDQSMNSI